MKEKKEYFRKKRDYFREITFRNSRQARLLSQLISSLLYTSLDETQFLNIKFLFSYLFEISSDDKELKDDICKEIFDSFESLLRR